ncbi:MAG: ABC transporter permease [Planctomycetes bacterium]|nr:ABC transporter permease [Planctomycetota bacterium]
MPPIALVFGLVSGSLSRHIEAARGFGSWILDVWNVLAIKALVVSPAVAIWLGWPKAKRPREGKSQWTLVRERFVRSPMAHWGLLGVVFLYLLLFLAPFLAPYGYDYLRDPANLKLVGPLSDGYLLGSDQYSRDIYSRIIYGSRISLTIGFVAVGLSVSLGLLLGLLAGFFGGWVDFTLMRFVDYLLSIPRLVLLLVVMALFKDVVPAEFRVHLMVVILGITGWMGTCRIVRSEVLSLKERDFVQAGRALGYSSTRIMLRHVAPNCLAPVIVAATLGIGATILVEASLSFLGLGVPEPVPSWGKMVADGKEYITKAWWMTVFPGFTIVAAVLAFNLLGDGLRDALDPRSSGSKKIRIEEMDDEETSSQEAA